MPPGSLWPLDPRSHSSPRETGRPPWDGSLKLIEAGALDDGGVDGLANRLGIGPRHLVRLFRKHEGSTPLQAARSMRVQRAKRLIDETTLPMTEIAERAGFASVRSFNATFREVYRCAPSELRRRARGHALAARGSLTDERPSVARFS
jgi:AraC family transcriptional regulator, regulatory protein of adaptative response / methylated-DNA-[protein]-cysteine methyltransferase